jgi:hypothetical protein
MVRSLRAMDSTREDHGCDRRQDVAVPVGHSNTATFLTNSHVTCSGCQADSDRPDWYQQAEYGTVVVWSGCAGNLECRYIMASATWAVGRRMWGNVKQLSLEKTVKGMAKQMLLYESLYLLGADKKFDSGVERGEMLVKVQDTFLLTVEDIIGAEGEDYMMAEICPTGGHYNILRYAKPAVGGGAENPAKFENIILWVVGPLSRRVVTYTGKPAVGGGAENPAKFENIILWVVEPLSRRVVTYTEKCAVVEVRLESISRKEKCAVVEVRLESISRKEKCAVVEVRLKIISRRVVTYTEEKPAKNIIMWVVEGSSGVFYSDTWVVYDRDTYWVVAYTEMSGMGEKEVFTKGGFTDTMLEELEIFLNCEGKAVLYDNNQRLVEVRQSVEKGDCDCWKQGVKRKNSEENFSHL